MYATWLTTVKSFFKSILLHLILLGLLTFSLTFSPKPVKPVMKEVNIVNAVSVDKSEVQAELNKLKEAEENKKLKEQKRQKELEQKAKQAEQQRKKEEQKLQELKKQQEQKKAEEALRLKKLKEQEKKAEQKRKEEEEKKRKAEAERKKIEEQKRKAEEEKKKAEQEKKRLEEEKRKEAERLKKLEEERKKKEAEEALRKQMEQEAEEERLREQAAGDASLSQKIAAELRNKVSRNFNRSGLESGLTCKLKIQLVPGGEVVAVSISKSSGNDIFDRRAISAVKKAAPFEVVPDDIEQFERLGLRTITFNFNPN